VRSTVPVVFLNGTADTADPPANVADATATLPNALLVSVPGTGHWTLANATDRAAWIRRRGLVVPKPNRAADCKRHAFWDARHCAPHQIICGPGQSRALGDVP
jgi:hypothetical protein